MDMMSKKIAFMLRSLREDKNLSVDDVVLKLSEFGIDIAAKTIYNWETAHSMPKINILIALCVIYDATDLLSVLSDDFHNREPKNDTKQEQQLVSMFRELNEEGQEKLSDYAVDLVSSGRYKKLDKLELGKEKNA